MISILLVESLTAVRDAFATALCCEEGITVVATAATVREAVNLAWVHQPDVALIDVEMPKNSAFDLVEQLRASVPHCRPVMLTSLDAPGHMRKAYDQGAWAYLTEDQPFAEIVHAIRMVDSGKHLIDPIAADDANKTPLTPRETDVLRTVARMGTTAEIAKEMHLSPGTVNNYISSILTKMGVDSRVQALVTARNNGWL